MLALVRDEAARHGAAISGCEVVGLMPEAAMLDAAEHALQLESFRRDQVLELRLKQPPLTEAVPLGLVLRLRWPRATPTPGGGTVAAFVGRAGGAACATMVANLTLGKKKYAAARGGDAASVQARGRARCAAELLALGARATARRSTRCSGRAGCRRRAPSEWPPATRRWRAADLEADPGAARDRRGLPRGGSSWPAVAAE